VLKASDLQRSITFSVIGKIAVFLYYFVSTRRDLDESWRVQ